MQENSVFSVLNAVNCNEHVEKGEEGSESCFESGCEAKPAGGSRLREGVSTLGSSEGGARRIQVPASAGTQETLGGKK